MIDFYQRMKTGRITFEEAKPRFIRFDGLLDMTAGRKNYKEKKVEVLKNAKLLIKVQKLIYSRFVVEILNHDNSHRFGSKETFSDRYDDKAIYRSNYN